MLILAFCWFKQAVALVSHVGFHALLWEPLSRLARGFPRVALGKTLLRDVTGEPCWNLGGYLMLVLRWDESVVTLLVLRRYGVYTVFDSRVRYLSQPVLRRESSGPSFRRWRASFERRKSYKRGSRESENADAPRLLNCRISVRMGRSPAHGAYPCYTFMWRKINFYPCIKTLTRFTHL